MLEGEVFSEGNVGAGHHLVVEMEVAAGSHNQPPAGFTTLCNVFGDLSHQIVSQILEGDLCRVFLVEWVFVSDAEGVAFTEVVTDVVGPQLLEAGTNLR